MKSIVLFVFLSQLLRVADHSLSTWTWIAIRYREFSFVNVKFSLNVWRAGFAIWCIHCKTSNILIGRNFFGYLNTLWYYLKNKRLIFQV